MSESHDSGLSVMPPTPPAYAATWQLKLIAEHNFAGRVISRKTAAERFGVYDPDAPIVVRIQRILDMAPYLRGLPGAAGIWIDAVLKRIKAAAYAAGNASERYSSDARAQLRATYEGLVIQTEKMMEDMIRSHLGGETKNFENLSSAANFTVGAGSYAQPSRRQIHAAAPKFSAEGFVLRLRAAGIWPRRDDATSGFSWAGGAALSPHDKELLQDNRLEIDALLTARPDLCAPPTPPPPPPIVQEVEEEPAEVQAIPVADAGPIAPMQAEPEPVQEAAPVVEPAEPAELAEPSAGEAVANPAAQPRRRRHRFA